MLRPCAASDANVKRSASAPAVGMPSGNDFSMFVSADGGDS